MRVFGIDCGTEFTGYGVVEVDCDARMPRLVHLAAGTIRLSKKEKTPQRLAQVYAELTALMALHQPEVVAIEEVFFSANAKSALKLGQVRGVAMLAAATSGLPVAEYAPLSIKSSVVGYGLAAKEQVQFMVTRLLELDQAVARLHQLGQQLAAVVLGAGHVGLDRVVEPPRRLHVGLEQQVFV